MLIQEIDYLFKLSLRNYAAGWVRRGIQNNEFCPRRDRPSNMFGSKYEIIVLGFNENRRCPCKRYYLGKSYPVRLDYQDLIARIYKRDHGVKNCLFASRSRHHFRRFVYGTKP